jgi:hypothetical protein
MFSLKHLPTLFPLSAIRRAPPLDHWHMTTWRRERFFLDDLLPWFEEVLNHCGLMAMLWRYSSRNGLEVGLIRVHFLLECLAEPNKLTTLDE